MQSSSPHRSILGPPLPPLPPLVLALALALTLLATPAARAALTPAWVDFHPVPAPNSTPASAASPSPINLRHLNERNAGDGGFIAARDGQFIHRRTGQTIRFWAVNGPSSQANTPETLAFEARLLAQYGVNLVRLHKPMFNQAGETDPDRVRLAHSTVRAMKTEGVYTLFSIYFPLWFKPAADHPVLKGYDGSQHPFAVLFFNPEFQARYRDWWRALLLTPDPDTGLRLVDEPAVFGLEVQNEDSLFFWTFAERNLPRAQWEILEARFAGWLIQRHSSLDATLAAWNGLRLPGDAPASGRMAFRPLWNVFTEKTRRDQDTVAFLLELQRGFYTDTIAFLRSLGFKGVITASNWTTANNAVLGPLEKLSYTPGDFIDRHGYFSCNHKGDNAAWSIRDGHTFSHRSALRFDPETPGKPRSFVHPAMDIQYDGLPSMISETTWTRPNRYRSEAPLFLAAFGALQDSAAIVHFAFDGSRWQVKPNFWMQPWTLASPALLAQFPATALLFRKSLVNPGEVLASIQLNLDDLQKLKGTPLPQDAAFDELRLQDIPDGVVALEPGQVIDPLIHFAGRTRVTFGTQPQRVSLQPLKPWIDRTANTVRASNRQLELDYRLGLLRINAPSAQGASGNLAATPIINLHDVRISSPLDLAHILVIALDDLPLRTSRRMLLQTMSEERTTGFQTEPADAGTLRIRSIGRDPWQFKAIEGSIEFKRPDAATLRVTPLAFDGSHKAPLPPTPKLQLQPDTLYYLLEAP